MNDSYQKSYPTKLSCPFLCTVPVVVRVLQQVRLGRECEKDEQARNDQECEGLQRLMVS